MADLILNSIQSRDGTVTQDIKNLDATTVSGVTAKNGMATAWVNFDGTNGVIRDSYNISSVVRSDTGRYTVNFATPMDNTNFVVAGVGNSTSNGYRRHLSTVDNRDVTYFLLQSGYSDSVSDVFQDSSFVTVAIFGGKN